LKILYLSCHEILEFDEVSLLHELGHEVFSPGAYVEPKNRGDQHLRPDISTLEYDPDIVAQYNEISQTHEAGKDTKDYLTKEFVDNFDTVIVMHMPRWIHLNWNAMRERRVIWRTIGQSLASVEQQMQVFRNDGLQVVRYSPNEANIPHFCGQDALIRFYKDPNVYKNWNGNEGFVITFGQDMQGRGSHCNYTLFEEITRPFLRKLFGPGNHQEGFGMGRVSYDQLLQEMRNNRVYLYTGTQPASYTLNFIEAWMTGIPVVALGAQHGNADQWRNHNLYEIPTLITDGHDGFVSDDPEVLRQRIATLLNDHDYAAAVGAQGRQSAIRHFNKDMIMNSWKAFLEGTT